MNTGTRLRSILVAAMCVNAGLATFDVTQFHNPVVDMVYKVATVIVIFVIAAIGTYFNNDFTEEGCVGTGKTRLEKAKKKDNLVEWTEDDADDKIIDEVEDDELGL